LEWDADHNEYGRLPACSHDLTTAPIDASACLDAESILGHPDHAVGERTNG
jgi:hypothetical protein